MTKARLISASFLLSVLFVSKAAAGQTFAGIYDSTIHHRIIFSPPFLLNGNDTLRVDADGDSISDLRLQTANGELSLHCFGGASYFYAEYANCQVGSMNGLFVEPYKFSFSDSLTKSDSALEYISIYPSPIAISIVLSGCNANYNSWVNINKYIGFRLINGSDTAYGWVEPYLTAPDTMYVYQVVCESDHPGTVYYIGVEEVFDQGEFEVFPNPFGSVLTISGFSLRNTVAISLIDITGKEIILESTSSAVMHFRTETISPGVYCLRIRDGLTVRNYKMIKAE